MEYVDSEGERKRRILSHRAIFGSVERFFGVLVESYAGKFPLWLAPEQLRLLPVAEESREVCNNIVLEAKARGLKVAVDTSGDRLNKIIRTSQKELVALVGVVDAKEAANNTIIVRSRVSGELGDVALEDVLGRLEFAVTNAVDYEAVDAARSR